MSATHRPSQCPTERSFSVDYTVESEERGQGQGPIKKSARRRRSTRQPPLVLHCLDPSRRRAGAGIICCDGALHCSTDRAPNERVNVQGQRTKGCKHSARASTGSRWPTEQVHARTLWPCTADGGWRSQQCQQRRADCAERAERRSRRWLGVASCVSPCAWRACVSIARVQDSTSTVTLALSEQNSTGPVMHGHLSRRIGPENRNLNPVPPRYLVSDFYASPTNVIGLHLCDVTSRRAGLADPGEGPATGVAVVLSSDSRCFYTESW